MNIKKNIVDTAWRVTRRCSEDNNTVGVLPVPHMYKPKHVPTAAEEQRAARNNWRQLTSEKEQDALGTLDHSLTMKANSMYPASKKTDWSTATARDYPDTVRGRDPAMKMKTTSAKKSGDRFADIKTKPVPKHGRDRVGDLLTVPMPMAMSTSSGDAFAFTEMMQDGCLEQASEKEYFQKRHAFTDYVEALAKNPQFQK